MQKIYKFINKLNQNRHSFGYLKNIPNSAIFYKIFERFDRWAGEEWIIMIPTKDFHINFQGKECNGFYSYNLIEWTMIYIHDIEAIDWIDVGKEGFDYLFEDFFKSIYIKEYVEEINPNLDNIISTIEDTKLSNQDDITYITGYTPQGLIEKTISVSKIKELKNGYFIINRLIVWDDMYNKPVYIIKEDQIEYNNFKLSSYKSHHHNIELTHDSFEYNKEFNKLIKYFNS